MASAKTSFAIRDVYKNRVNLSNKCFCGKQSDATLNLALQPNIHRILGLLVLSPFLLGATTNII